MPIQNLLTTLPTSDNDEVVEQLAAGQSFRLERILSTGQITPAGQWLEQPAEEWVVLLSGAARLRFEDELDERLLKPGDSLLIAGHRRHRVEWTDPDQPSVWVALHFTP